MSESPPDSTGLPARVGGKYRPIRHIATGGMGSVYEVEHEGTGERLALKLLKGGPETLEATALQRFRREARVHAVLKSEHVVRVIDADVAPELGGAPFLVMDLLEGENLGDLTGDEPQSASRVVGWLLEIAGPLDAAHAAGIIHRDLKPENLFLTRRPDGSAIVKILDFGIAKMRGGDVSKTGTGAVIGTPLYMAPEQATADHERVGPGTDMWSIGMIAFRLLTGRVYWSTTNVSLLLAELVGKPLKAPSSRVPRLSKAFDQWFLRSCHRDPSERFESMNEQVRALAKALNVDLPEVEAHSGAQVTSLDLSVARSRPRAQTPAQSISGSVAIAEPRERAGSRAVLVGALLAIAVLIAGVLLSRDRGGPAASSSASQAQAPPQVVAPSAASDEAPALQPLPPLPSASAALAPSSRKVARPPVKPLAPRPSASAPAVDPLADPK